jgi:hypothetical protein
VQVTWPANSAFASSVPFQIYDGSTLLQTVTVNEQLAPNGPRFGPNNIAFQALGFFTINSGTIKVVLGNNATGGTYVLGDAMRLSITPTATLDLNWSANGDGITGPMTSSTTSTFTINRAYTLSGTGTAPAFTIGYFASASGVFGSSDNILIGTENVAAGETPGNFSGTSPALTIPTGGTYYLLAQLNSSSSLAETNPNNNVTTAPQQINVTTTVPVFVANNQSGFSETGSWGANNALPTYSPTYADTRATGSASSTTATATWQVTNLAAGNYTVQVTWPAYSGSASSIPYQIYDGNTLLQTVIINGQVAPNGPTFGPNSIPFQTLGTFTINNGTLKVVVGNNATGGTYILADALRVS